MTIIPDELRIDRGTGTTSTFGDLIQVDRALESWRDAGYDLSAAVGEVLDNSIEAGARLVRIRAFEAQGGAETKRGKGSIDALAFADNGAGIPVDILPNALTMGFSSRYNKRNGLGRFGVGAKLAALSQARRVDIYTKSATDSSIYRTFFDLDLIKSGEQNYLSAEKVESFPEKYANLMTEDNVSLFESGTLVIWSKVDRLEQEGAFGSSIGEKKTELIKYLARTYRKFMQNGFRVVFDGKEVVLHDPLFLLDSPRAQRLLGDDWKAAIVDTKELTVDGHKVDVTVTLLPKSTRLVKGEGAVKGSAARLKELSIAENEGCVSILRHGREIYYDLVPKLLPQGKQDGDRFVGIEIAFPAALDEYFQVRHVKRGAEPVDKLRLQIRDWLIKPVTTARNEIRATWGDTGKQDHQDAPQHIQPLEVLTKVDETAPRGMGGADMPAPQVEQVLEDAAKDLGATTPAEIEVVKERLRNETLSVIDGDWPGSQLFDLQHVNGRVIVKLNWRHPFMRKVYVPIKELATGSSGVPNTADIEEIARRAVSAIDLMLFTYAKAENMHRHPDDQYGALRTFWGQFLADGIQELVQR